MQSNTASLISGSTILPPNHTPAAYTWNYSHHGYTLFNTTRKVQSIGGWSEWNNKMIQQQLAEPHQPWFSKSISLTASTPAATNVTNINTPALPNITSSQQSAQDPTGKNPIGSHPTITQQQQQQQQQHHQHKILTAQKMFRYTPTIEKTHHSQQFMNKFGKALPWVWTVGIFAIAWNAYDNLMHPNLTRFYQTVFVNPLIDGIDEVQHLVLPQDVHYRQHKTTQNQSSLSYAPQHSSTTTNNDNNYTKQQQYHEHTTRKVSVRKPITNHRVSTSNIRHQQQHQAAEDEVRQFEDIHIVNYSGI